MTSPVVLQKQMVTLDVQLKRLIAEMQDCDDAEVLALRTREASESLREMAGIIRNIDDIVRATGRTEKDDMNRLVETYWTMLHDNRIALRKANVAAQKSIDSRERSALLLTSDGSQAVGDGSSGGTGSELGPGLRRRGKMEKEVLVRNSSNVTERLLGISRSMNEQVVSSNATLDHLVDSSSTIVESAEEAKAMDGVIRQSSKLLSKYDRRETTDKILIFLSFLFFFACVLYVLKKRAGIPFSWLWSWIF